VGGGKFVVNHRRKREYQGCRAAIGASPSSSPIARTPSVIAEWA
jgi:hypothetical protein